LEVAKNTAMTLFQPFRQSPDAADFDRDERRFNLNHVAMSGNRPGMTQDFHAVNPGVNASLVRRDDPPHDSITLRRFLPAARRDAARPVRRKSTSADETPRLA